MVNASGGLDTSNDGVFFGEYPRCGLVIHRNQECGGQIARADVFNERVLNRVNRECHRVRVTRRGRSSTKVRSLSRVRINGRDEVLLIWVSGRGYHSGVGRG